MTGDAGPPPRPLRLAHRLGRGTALLALLVAAVAAVLLHGFARQGTQPEAPATPAAAPAAAPSEPEPPGLRADLEKTPLAYQSDYWRQLGRRARSGLLVLGAQRTPALLVAPGLAVTAIAPFPETRSAAGEDADGRLRAADARAGLALFEVRPRAEKDVLAPAEPAALHAGMLVAAVTLDAEEKLSVVPGYLRSRPAASTPAELDAFVPLPADATAAAIVDLDGRLVGAAFRARAGVRLLTAGALAAAVERLRARSSCLWLEVSDLDGAARSALGVSGGVAVEWVADEAFASPPPIRPADVILQWGATRVESAAQFAVLSDTAGPGEGTPYVVQRAGRALRGRLALPPAGCRPVGALPARLPRTGLALSWDAAAGSRSWRVTEVAEGSPAGAAGVKPDDRIRSAGARSGREAVLLALRAFEEGQRSVLLVLGRGDRVKLVALRPVDAR